MFFFIKEFLGLNAKEKVIKEAEGKGTVMFRIGAGWCYKPYNKPSPIRRK